MKNWIPIKDNPPRYYEDIAVLTNDGAMFISSRDPDAKDPSGFDIKNITHWMPLENGSSIALPRTNRQWLRSLNDMQLSLLLKIGLPCHNIIYDYDALVSLEMFHTSRELREWLSQRQQFTYGYKDQKFYKEEGSL